MFCRLGSESCKRQLQIVLHAVKVKANQKRINLLIIIKLKFLKNFVRQLDNPLSKMHTIYSSADLFDFLIALRKTAHYNNFGVAYGGDFGFLVWNQYYTRRHLNELPDSLRL